MPARRCLIFYCPPCAPRVKRARMTSSFELAIDMISICENPNFCFDKLDFLAEKKTTELLISLGTAPPTRCPLDVYVVIRCCAHRRFNFCCPGCLSRGTCVRMSAAFSCDIGCVRHACDCVRSSFFCSPGLPPNHLLYACCKTPKGPN